jgi:hypothetical protein
MLRLRSPCIAVASFLALGNAGAHHSYSEYDDKEIVEIEGTLVNVALQNPHVHFFLRGTDENGRAVTWDLESTTLNWGSSELNMKRAGWMG